MRRQGFAPDGEKLLSMLLLHEAGEVIVGDIPSPAAALLGPGAKSRAESAAAAAVLREHPERAALVEEFETGDSLEARVARSLDKLQLILKVLEYESQGRGGLAEFWDYGGNFPRCGVPAVDGLFGEARALRGKPGLDYLATLSAAALSGPG
jgi:putative hydrolase of HD superfamily